MPASRRKIVLPGGSGLLGRLLSEWFSARDWDVVVLTRRPSAEVFRGVRFVPWDGRTLRDWKRELEGATAVVNLAGRSVDCRYTARNRRAIYDSRVDSTRALGEAIEKCAEPPEVWLNSSTATIYKHSLDRPMDEFDGEIGATPEAKDEFSIEVARAWEQAIDESHTPRTRHVALRTAMVFSRTPGGVFHVLRRLTRFGLGGKMGPGRQFVSWIHETDFCRSVEWLIDHDEIAGPVNLAGPNPVPNREMMRLFRKSCGMPFGLPHPNLLLQFGAWLLRTETELVIKSRRVVPRRLLESGFEFRFHDLQSTIVDLSRATLHGTPTRVPCGTARHF